MRLFSVAGGSAFADPPAFDALEAAVFWAPDHLAELVVLDAVALPHAGDTVDLGALDVSLIECRQPDGRRFVELRQAPHRICFEVGIGDIMCGPFLPRFRLAGLARLAAQLMTLQRFDGLCRLGRFPVRLFAPERRAGRWTLLLRVHDGLQDGARQRELAAALFGIDTVRADWRSESDYLRSRIKRLVRDAERMVDGGYLRLLA